MAKKSGLGRGLGSLLVDDLVDLSDKQGPAMKDIDQIYPREDQPRKYFDDQSLENLAKSIKDHGIIQPLLVTEKNGKFEIVAGERRYRAAKLAGLTEIPVVVKDLDDREIKELSIIENVQREDLNPIEEALAYRSLIDEFSMTQEDVAGRVGKSRSYIGNSLRLLNLDEDIQVYLIQGDLSSSQARTLLSIKDPGEREKTLKAFLNKETNIRAVEKKKKTKAKIEKNIFVEDIENRLTESLEAKVNLRIKRKGGQIIINYFDDDDLARIINILEDED